MLSYLNLHESHQFIFFIYILSKQYFSQQTGSSKKKEAQRNVPRSVQVLCP